MIPLLLACVTEAGDTALPSVDPAVFTESVEPILTERCSNPSCHGQAGRPFEVYAVHFHRMDPEDLWLDTPLSDEEHAANQRWATSFATAPWELARKPLAPEAGGMRHTGGALWPSEEDHEYIVLRDWVGAP